MKSTRFVAGVLRSVRPLGAESTLCALSGGSEDLLKVVRDSRAVPRTHLPGRGPGHQPGVDR